LQYKENVTIRKVVGELSCNIPSRHKEEVEVQLYPYLTSTLEVAGWGTPRPSRFATGTRCALYRRQSVLRGRYGWVRKNFEPTGVRGPSRPTRWWSLYRLRYHGSCNNCRQMTSQWLPKLAHVSATAACWWW